MLISLLAGSVGLNLTGGNHLFLLDMHWNPSLEDQACDRIYRVGQQKDVVIHKFVCEGTVEEKILQLQEKRKIWPNRFYQDLENLSPSSPWLTSKSFWDLTSCFFKLRIVPLLVCTMIWERLNPGPLSSPWLSVSPSSLMPCPSPSEDELSC